MTGSHKALNTRLGALLSEAGISAGSLAHRLRRRAAAAGITVAYTHRSVADWIRAGVQPQHGVPHLIADIVG